MTLLVTGGSGFIGSNFILEWMASAGEPIVNLDKLTYAGNPHNLTSLSDDPRYRFVQGDIGDQHLVEDVLARHHVRAVLNFAAESHVDRSISGPAAFIDTNVTGTFGLLEAVRRHFQHLPPGEQATFRFLHVSTDEVYGSLSPEAVPFTEQHPYRPNSPYAASKAASDHLVRAYGETYGLPVLITNCSNNYGPYHFPEKLIPLVIHNALAGKALPVYGDGRQVRDWLYVHDHCGALRLVLERGQPGETYNIGGGNERTNIEVVTGICALLDRLQPRPDRKPYATQIAHVADRPGHDRRYAVDAGKLRTALGWRPLESFDSGLAKTVRWNLANGPWIDRITTGDYRRWIELQYA